jgi:hypothetical protein
LSAIVDRPREALVSAWQRAEIDDLPALPKHSMNLGEAAQRIGCTVFRIPGNQPVATDPVDDAPLAAGKRAQIVQHTVLPLKGTRVEAVVEVANGIDPGGVRGASDRPLIADGAGTRCSINFVEDRGNAAVGTAERTKVDEFVTSVILRG